MFSGIEIFAKPFAHNHNNSMTYFSLNTDDFPEWVKQLLLVLWAGFYSLIVAAVAIQFIFRYLCLLGAEVTKHSNWFQNILWVSYPILPGTVYAVLLYVLSMPDEYSDAYVKDAIFNNYDLVLDNLPRFIMATYTADGSVRWKNLSYLGSAGGIVFVHYAIIIICGIKMHFKMKQGLQMFSVANQKLQKQFFKALIFQSLGPTIFIFLPAIPVLLGPLIPLNGVEVSYQSGWLFSVIGAYPPFDSISFMIIVVEYMKVIKSRYFKVFTGKSVSSVNTVSDQSRQKGNRMYANC
ncbi:hypothetical protein CAEBREN_00697 [Caenorhabditis brenneri]|uniref:Uncharacterized protein n=1 Tax=Caenorhabditis brenneri TaxID=135651 RepID=G0P654_CAEBE|nr:hypothetical protein CAEBREN_00697 [Caenorhabditis brenneri]